MQTMKINDASENEIVKQRFSQLLLIEKFPMHVKSLTLAHDIIVYIIYV